MCYLDHRSLKITLAGSRLSSGKMHVLHVHVTTISKRGGVTDTVLVSYFRNPGLIVNAAVVPHVVLDPSHFPIL